MSIIRFCSGNTYFERVVCECVCACITTRHLLCKLIPSLGQTVSITLFVVERDGVATKRKGKIVNILLYKTDFTTLSS